MVRLCDSEAVRQDFLAGVFGAAVGCQMEMVLQVYGDTDPQTNAWAVYSDNQAACGGILFSAGSLFVCLNRQEGADDCAQFLRFLFPGAQVECDGKTAEWLAPFGYAAIRTGDTLRYAVPAGQRQIPMGYHVPQELRLSDLYDLLCTCFGDFSRQQEHAAFLADVFLKKRYGARLQGLCKGDRLCAAAGIYAVGRTSALLSAVATAPEHRGRGLAGCLVTQLCREQAARGKEVFVMTRRPSLTRFYQNLGFIICGRWAVLKETKNG